MMVRLKKKFGLIFWGDDFYRSTISVTLLERYHAIWRQGICGWVLGSCPGPSSVTAKQWSVKDVAIFSAVLAPATAYWASPHQENVHDSERGERPGGRFSVLWLSTSNVFLEKISGV